MSKAAQLRQKKAAQLREKAALYRSAARDPVEGSSSTDLFFIELAEEFEREAEALENSKEEDTN